MPNHDSTRGYATDAAATTVSDPNNTCICSNDDASTGRKPTTKSPSSDDDMSPFYFCLAFTLAFLDVLHVLVMRSVEDMEMHHFFNGMSIVFLSMAFALLLFHQPEPFNHAPICPCYGTKGWRNGESGHRALLSIVLMITLAILFRVIFGESRPIEQSLCVLPNSTAQ